MKAAVHLYRCPEPFADQAQCERALYLSVKQLQKQAMIYFIKEAFQVYIHDMLIAIIDIGLCLHHALLGIFIWPESIAKICELRFKQRRDSLCNTLLQPPVHYCWNAQLPLFSIAFGYFYPQDGLRKVFTL